MEEITLDSDEDNQKNSLESLKHSSRPASTKITIKRVMVPVKKKQTATKSTTFVSNREKEEKESHAGQRHNLNLIHLQNDVNDFLEGFNPEYSNRERRKMSKKFSRDSVPVTRKSRESTPISKPLLSNNKPVATKSAPDSLKENDICDCFEDSCPGCFYPCSDCCSRKCGIECRKQRRWVLTTIWNEADQTMRYNPHSYKS